MLDPPLWELLEDSEPECPPRSKSSDERSCESSPATKRARVMRNPLLQRHLSTAPAEIENLGPLTWTGIVKHGFQGQVEKYVKTQSRPVRLQTACTGTGCAKLALEVRHAWS